MWHPVSLSFTPKSDTIDFKRGSSLTWFCSWPGEKKHGSKSGEENRPVESPIVGIPFKSPLDVDTYPEGF